MLTKPYRRLVGSFSAALNAEGREDLAETISTALRSAEFGAIERVFDRFKCRHGCADPVVGIYHIPEGCWCFPDQVQALCGQHAIKVEGSEPIECLMARSIWNLDARP